MRHFKYSENKKLSAITAILLSVSLVISFSACGANPNSSKTAAGEPISAAVIYDSLIGDGSWRDCYSQLDQGLLMNLTAAAIDISEKIPDLSVYDVIYPDMSVTLSKNADDFAYTAESYVNNGGAVFLENGFYKFFGADFLGAKSFAALDNFPNITKTSSNPDFADIKSIVMDFHKLYGEYEDYPRLSSYGFGAVMKTYKAIPIISCWEGALYTLNSYGGGKVFWASAILPNLFSINGFDNLSKNSAQQALANTTASSNQLIRNYFAAYIARERDGVSVERVFGPNGSPSIAWELHAEEITGFEFGAEVRFAELAEQNGQAPSFSLVRSTYWWFLRTESVTYLLGKRDGDGGVTNDTGDVFNNSDGATYDMDLYENAYDTGTHIAVDYPDGARWLSLAEITNTSSFFYDNPDYADVKVFPAVMDYDGDGIIDLLCRSSDGNTYFFKGNGYSDRWHVAPPVILGADEADKIKFSDTSDLNGYIGGVTLSEPSHTGELTAKFGMNASPVYADINGDGIPDLIVGQLEYGKAYPIDSPYFPYREQLQKQIDSLLQKGYYIGVHFYTNKSASAAREQYEISATVSALKSYGIDTSFSGINQHTWHISDSSPNQSLLTAWNAGLLWSSGFEPQGTDLDPNDAAETAISLPYFLEIDGERTMLIQNVSALLFNAERAEISAKYNMPMCIYNHCDFTYRDEASELQKIKTVEAFVNSHGYSFVSEPQMMKATAAEYNAFVTVQNTDGVITLTAKGLADDFPLYDPSYQNSVGAKVTFSANSPKYDTNADIYRLRGNSIYVSLNKPVSFTERHGIGSLIDGIKNMIYGEKAHILSVNLPANIITVRDGKGVETGADIEFLDGVMNEVRVAGNASTTDPGWTVKHVDGISIFTHFGEPSGLHIDY